MRTAGSRRGGTSTSTRAATRSSRRTTIGKKRSQIGERRGRRCGTVRIGRWRRRATRLPASRSWTSWRRAAGADPLEFRLAHLDDPRLRPVLEEAARRFNWAERVKKKQPNRGVGLACSIDKGSFVAACVEVEVDPETKEIRVRARLRGVRVRRGAESGQSAQPDGRGDHHGPRARRSARKCSSRTARSRTRLSATTACRISRTCRRSTSGGESARSATAGRGRDADHRDRAGDRRTRCSASPGERIRSMPMKLA